MGHPEGVYAFDAATAVRSERPGTYAIDLDPAWSVGPGLLNGGYLMALGVRAALADGPHPDPLAVSATFLRPLAAGPATALTVPLRSGRTVASTRVSLTSAPGEPPGVDLQVTTASLCGDAPEWTDVRAPAIAAPQDCLGMTMPGYESPGLAQVLQYAFDPDTSGWLRGRPGTEPLLNLWLRFADGRPVDPLALVLMADACPPVSFATGRLGWAPTISMQVLVRGRPAPGWCQVQARSRLVAGGFSDEEAMIWDSTGALVAQARQIAVPPRHG
ncbi:MAG: thioesterase family protein [Geodermatophilaceae bacterium]|nr:thioesterase family protein [Geodermatophilaceae bacterium]